MILLVPIASHPRTSTQMPTPGAHFRKADLQIHSPRDRSWEGDRPGEDVTDEADIKRARAEWADAFIAKCRERRLQAVAITDHHEGILVWDIIQSAERLRAGDAAFDLWVFPGMELTAKDSAQALVIFDASLTAGLFAKARALLRLPTDCDESNARGIQADLLAFNVDEIQGILESDDELRGRFIILPNVTPRGHKTVLRNGFHRRFREMPYVGGYLDGITPDDLAPGDLRILQGEIPAWGSQRLGIVTTSDAREADFRKIGSHVTWIKLASPTAESIRQAMLAADSRLRYSEPRPPPVYIERVRVGGAVYLAIEELTLNPQYNAVIGGRGAGKSTLLEFVRFALGRSALDIGSTEWDPTHPRRKEIIEKGLDSIAGEVAVTIRMDGAPITLVRRRAVPLQIDLDVEGIHRPITPEDARALISVQTFSQGELSHLGQDKAEQRLLEVVTEPEREAFDEIERQLRNAANSIAAQLTRRVQKWRLDEEIRRTEAELRTVEARLKALQGELSTGDDASTTLIENHAAIEAADEYVGGCEDAVRDVVEQLVRDLDRGSARLAHVAAKGGNIGLPSAETTAIAVNALKDRVDSARALIVAETEQFVDTHSAVKRVWEPEYAEHKRRYDDAVERLADHRATAEQIHIVGNTLTELRVSLDALNGEALQLADSDELFVAAVNEHQHWQLQRVDHTAAVAATIGTLSGGLANAELARSGNLEPLYEALVALFHGTGVRDARIREVVNTIKDSVDPLQLWWTLLKEILETLEWKVSGRRELEPRPALPLLDATIDAGGLERLTQRLEPERVMAALRTEIPPRLRITLQRNGRTVEFRQASQGERATTLLTVLMHQEGGPLIIDQPEEDLDNRIMNEIVGSVRSEKDRRQLIFATHSANLVVNGDAEYIIDLNSGAVSADGAIDESAVKDAITSTMEGGRDAFELRRKKYNF